jgi:hypothetical protein
MDLPCHNCLTLPMCRNTYSHCKAIECNLVKEYFQEPLIQHSSRIFEFNSFLWRRSIAEEYIDCKKKEN